MDCAEIDLRIVKTAINSVLDHIIEDLGIERVAIDPAEDYYWECAAPDLYDRSKAPSLDAGRLTERFSTSYP
jgi:hypothetical protein